ncbi:YccT family protein [Shewanella youngdeokensis]|uniref:UPF0319 protein RGE70_11195 n=1 Tax=Shewanella youngdeokensis TaxID=2999068 RepID=A0ABZ0JUB7_9GAMM|nr:DUF2057 domain-containing protein [Shewanella sp. DAU334]
MKTINKIFKKLYLRVAVTMLVCTNSAALASVKLTLPANSELILLNGKEVSTSKAISLTNGEHQLALRYFGRYRQHGETVEYHSEIIILTFSAEDTQLNINSPIIRTRQAAEAFDRAPIIAITDPKLNKIAFKQDYLIKDGMQIGRDYEKEIALYNQSQQITTLEANAFQKQTLESYISNNIIQKEEIQSQQTESHQLKVSQMLDFWYKQASPETRKAFKLKIETKNTD